MTDSRPSAGTLEDLRVLDLGVSPAARFCAHLLAVAGADVARPGDASAAEYGSSAVIDFYLDRAKRVVDGITAQQRRQLAARANVITCDAENNDIVRSMSRDDPALISVTVTAFGEDGARAGWKGDDLIAVCAGGLAHATPGLPDFSHDLENEPPLRSDALVGELVSGVQAASAVLMAALVRDQTGRGARIIVSKQEAVAALVPWDVNLWTYGGAIVGRREVRAHLAPNVYLPGKDGWVVMVAFSEEQWQSLVEVMGSPDWAESDLFADGISRGEHSEALHALLEDWLKTKDQWDFLNEVQKRSIPSAPVLDLSDAISNDHARERGYIGPVHVPGVGETALPGNVFVVDGRRDSPGILTETGVASLLNEWGEAAERGESAVSEPNLPLRGVRVLDFSQFVAMPLAGEWLQLMGAEVLLVESRGNLASRRWAPFAGNPEPDTCGLFNNINKGKKSVTLNLRTPKGCELAREIAATCDLVIENYSPGTMERLELGYADLRKMNPRLSMVSLSAFGSTGPWRDFVSFHSGVAALSGFAAVTGYEGSYPRIIGAVAPDTIAATYCYLAALRALRTSRRTGEGQHIELAMSEVLQSLMPEAIARTSLGEKYERVGNRHERKSPHNVFRCRGDDAWVAVSVSTDEEWWQLVSLVGLENLRPQSAYSGAEARRERERDVERALARWVASKTADEAAGLLQSAGVPATKVFNARDIVDDEHLRERGFIAEIDHPKAGTYPYVGVPWRIEGLPAPAYRHAPLVGDATDYVLSEILGLDATAIERLKEDQAVH